jgi:uncharacterized protein (TIGR02118 family)
VAAFGRPLLASTLREHSTHRDDMQSGARRARVTGRRHPARTDLVSRLHSNYDFASAFFKRRCTVARLVVVYKTPKDTNAFDRHYFETHVPLAKKIPGLRKYEVSTGPVVSPAGPSGVHLMAILQFDDAAAIQRAFASLEGQAAAADVQTFASGGADLFFFDSREV